MNNKKLPKLADIQKCTGCLACIDACPKGALSMIINEEGHYTYKLDAEKCIGCLQCERVCPTIGDKCYGDNSLKNPIFAAWTNDSKLRKRSSSGGVAAALATYIVEHGGVVFGATMDGMECHHIAVDSIDNLPRLQGSKYMQSDTTGTYRNMLEFLKKGKTVLFTGTPCQVAAAINYVHDENLCFHFYTLDMVCGGVPSLFLRDRFIKEYGNNVKTIDSFRNKDKGWKSLGYAYELKVVDNKGDKISFGLHNLLLGGFGMGLTNRRCCYNCNFAKVNRKSDFTVADFWGDTKFKEQHHDGLSTLSVHTAKGKNLLNIIDSIECRAITWEKVLPYNYRYSYGKSIIKYSWACRHLSRTFERYSYSKLCKIYAGAVTPKQFGYYVLKVLNVILGKLNRRKGIKYINRHILDWQNENRSINISY